jgi:hypothetical protein
VVADVRAAFERYEQAIVTNDVSTLCELFLDDRRTTGRALRKTSTGFPRLQPFVRPALR